MVRKKDNNKVIRLYHKHYQTLVIITTIHIPLLIGIGMTVVGSTVFPHL